MDDRPGMSFKQWRVYVYVWNRPVECLCVKDVSRVDSWWTPAWRRCESELMQCHSHLDLALSLSLAPSATVSSLSQSGLNPPPISLSLALFIPTLACPKPFTQDQVAGVKGGSERKRERRRALYQQVWLMGLSAVSQAESPWRQEVSLPCIAAFCATSCSLEHAFQRHDWSCGRNACAVCFKMVCVKVLRGLEHP